MTVNLGSITLIAGVPNTFTTPSTGLAGILIGNDSGFTCAVQVGSNSPRNILPGSVDFFPVDSFYHGVIVINPSSTLSTAGLYPAQEMYFEAVGPHEGFNPAGYPMSLPRNTTGTFAGGQTAYRIYTFQLPQVSGTNVIALPPIAANTSIQPLTLYGNFVFTLHPSTAALLVLETGGSETNSVITPGSSTHGWLELTGPNSTGTITASIPTTPSGKGFGANVLLFSNQGFPAGNWSASIGMTYGIAITVTVTMRVFTFNSNTNTYTLYGSLTTSGVNLSAIRTNVALPSTALPAIPIPSGSYLYIDIFALPTGSWNVADNINLFQGSNTTQGLANDVQINSPGMIVPASGSLINGNTLYTAQMSAYFGGIDLDVTLATNATQVQTRVLNLDTNLTQINGVQQVGWNYAVAANGNLNMRERVFANPFKSANGEQLEVTVFQNTGTEVISGQIYYYVQ